MYRRKVFNLKEHRKKQSIETNCCDVIYYRYKHPTDYCGNTCTNYSSTNRSERLQQRGGSHQWTTNRNTIHQWGSSISRCYYPIKWVQTSGKLQQLFKIYVIFSFLIGFISLLFSAQSPAAALDPLQQAYAGMQHYTGLCVWTDQNSLNSFKFLTSRYFSSYSLATFTLHKI